MCVCSLFRVVIPRRLGANSVVVVTSVGDVILRFLLNGKMSRCAVRNTARRSPASVSGSYDCADLGGVGEGYEKILAAALFLDAIALTNDEPAFSVSYFCGVCACLSC